jgi:hypothetical protein
MRNSTRFARRFAVLAAVTATAVAVVSPTVAGATIPTPVAGATWTLRTSWVNYITNPAWYGGLGQGTVANTASNGGTSAPNASSAYTTWAVPPYVNSAYSHDFAKASDAGTPRVVTLRGGLDFAMSAHAIAVSFSDLKVRDAGSGTEELVADATYLPVGGTTQSLSDTTIATIDATGAVALTATGATVFNGGANGSYAVGAAFGTVGYR